MKNLSFSELLVLGKSGDKNAIDEMNKRINLAAHDDELATLDIINAYERYIKKLAGKYTRICRTYSFDDMYSLGVLGVIRAIKRFDTSYGCLLTTLIFTEVSNSITSVSRQEWAHNNISITNLEMDGEDDSNHLTIGYIPDNSVNIFEEVSNKLESEVIRNAFDKLTYMQQKVMVGLFLQNKTAKELAKEFGMNERQIHSYKYNAIDKLQWALKNVLKH